MTHNYISQTNTNSNSHLPCNSLLITSTFPPGTVFNITNTLPTSQAVFPTNISQNSEVTHNETIDNNNLILDDEVAEDDISEVLLDVNETFSDNSVVDLNDQKSTANQHIIEHLKDITENGKCKCGAKRDTRSKPFVAENLTGFKQHITKHKDNPLHNQCYELYVKPFQTHRPQAISD